MCVNMYRVYRGHDLGSNVIKVSINSNEKSSCLTDLDAKVPILKI